MKKAYIISIGNEVVSGQTVDTNAAWLSRHLIELGIPVQGHSTVPDDINSIVDAVGQAARDADYVLVTGGLGPTDDDLTRQAIADYLNQPLELNNRLLNQIGKFFKKRDLAMAENNRRQAYLPKTAVAIENTMGTAPGFFCEQDEKIIFVMPGVPAEMKNMFNEHVKNQLFEKTANQVIVTKKIMCIGAGESAIARQLDGLMIRNRNPLINITCGHGVIVIHIIAQADSQKRAEEMADKDAQTIKAILGDLVYGQDDQTLAEAVGMKLKSEGKTLALAESCTGGLISKMITDIPGSSDYFTHGWVTYSDAAKISQLGVDEQIIKQYGAVSEQTARAMAEGAKKHSGADYAIAVTGIAGPGGGTEQKPVGLVFICVMGNSYCEVKRSVFSHTREFVRKRTALTALNMLRLHL